MDILQNSDNNKKQCTKCSRVLPATTEFFSPAKKDGTLYGTCKECRNMEWRLKHPDAKPRGKKSFQIDVPDGYRRCMKCKRILELNKNNFHVHPALKSGFHPRCIECRSKDTKVYREAHINPIKQREYDRAYRAANLQKIKRRAQEYRFAHKEEIRLSGKLYREKYPDKIRAYGRNKRARKRAVAGKHTAKQIREQYNRQKGKCWYCCKKVKWGEHHVDHTFPLSRVVGTDIPANNIDYLVITCKHCNLSKRDKFPWEWAEGGRLL